MNTIATLETVTAEQIARCERIVDMNTGRAFYLVKSEHYSENDLEYKVESIRKNDAWYVTCTCAAGQKAIACKHKRWAMAAARIEKMQRKAETQAAPATVVLPTLVVDGEQADELTTRRVMNAPAKVVDRKAKPLTNNKPFSILR